MTESAEGRLRAAVIDALHGNGYGIAHSGASCEELADALIPVVLDQAAEQIKALPIYGLKFLYRDDVLAILNGLRGDDA